jgi:hypothetical protein
LFGERANGLVVAFDQIAAALGVLAVGEPVVNGPTRPPTRSRASTTVNARAGGGQLARRRQSRQPGASHQHGHALE